MLLRLVPIGVEAGGECMNLVGHGLDRTRGYLRVAVHLVARAGCGRWDIIIGLIIILVRAPELHPRQWNGQALLYLLLGVQHRHPGRSAKLSDQGGMDQGSSAGSVSRLNQPSLNDRPDVELESLGHGVEEDRLVLHNDSEI